MAHSKVQERGTDNTKKKEKEKGRVLTATRGSGIPEHVPVVSGQGTL